MNETHWVFSNTCCCESESIVWSQIGWQFGLFNTPKSEKPWKGYFAFGTIGARAVFCKTPVYFIFSLGLATLGIN